MRIAYCDDETTQFIYLKELADIWEQVNEENCDIKVYGSAEEMLFENPESFPFDFIILDIEMDEMNGIDLARSIRKIDKNVAIAFLSNSSEYVFDGYEVQAVRYLMKPLKQEQLFPLFDMIKKSQRAEKRYIIVTSEGERVKLDAEGIMYIEALGHYVKIFAEDQIYEVKKNINDIAKELKDSGFVGTHRSYLVNLAFLDRITKTACILSDGVSVPISRNAYKAVNEAFIEYYKGGKY
jgi:DNA-binding LytR/AlgR family response regulator